MKNELRLVVENGVDISDPRIMPRTNEAQQEILAEMIPVNGMLTADVAFIDGVGLLPKEMENAIVVEVLGDATVNGQDDVKRGWTNIVNQFAYVDPAAIHDNPLDDEFLQPDPIDPTILRRQYRYPGLSSPATVRITGKKRYLPLVAEDDYPIVQNVRALKLMIQSIEREENLDDAGAKTKRDRCFEILTAEVHNHLMDPMKVGRRKGEYEADIINFPESSMGRMRARIALEVPGALSMGKEELTRLIGRAEMRGMEMGIFKGSVEEFDATIYGGTVYFPARVEGILGISLCGVPMDIHSIYRKYQASGLGNYDCTCGGAVEDMGDELLGGQRRRRYRINGSVTEGQTMQAVCALRWLAKAPNEQMVIRNFEAIRLLSHMLLLEQAEKWSDAAVAKASAKQVLDDELNQYLGGIAPAGPSRKDIWNFGELGEVL